MTQIQGCSGRGLVERAKDKNLVLIEIGVGYNTPSIIKFPFEKMTYFNDKTNLIRINKHFATCDREIEQKTILFNEELGAILCDLKKGLDNKN